MLPNPLEEIARKLDEYNKRLSHLERLEGTGAWRLIEDIHLSAPQATFDFQNIPATRAHLKILLHVRSDAGAISSQTISVRFNNDAGNNYDYHRISRRFGAADVATEGIGVAFMSLGQVSGALTPANTFDQTEIQIFDYADTNSHKSCRGEGGIKQSNVSGNVFILEATGYWRSTAAINRITLFPAVAGNFDTNSRATLYGITA